MPDRVRIFGPEFIERGHHFWFGPLVGLLIVAMLVVGAIIITRMLITRSQSGPAREPIAILEDRFARGEIDEKEFKARRTALQA
jgi:putative membrane protein